MMESAIEFIDSFAPDRRVLLFVLYKHQLDLFAPILKQKYPGYRFWFNRILKCNSFFGRKTCCDL